MTCSSFSHSAIGLMLVMFFVIGCSVAAPTDTPEPSPTPTIITAKPQPGTFSGSMESSIAGSNASASSEGSIKFTVSEDGAGIANAGYSIMGVKCSNPSGTTKITSGGWETELFTVEPSPIVDGNFVFISGRIKIKGHFTSPTEANGTIEISSEEREPTLPGEVGLGKSFICDFGTWVWSANYDPDVHFAPTVQPEESVPLETPLVQEEPILEPEPLE